MDFNKARIPQLLELFKDNVNELIKRLELINSNSAQSWEINAAREFVNTELFPAIQNKFRLFNDLIWNYEYDSTAYPNFKDYEINQVKQSLAKINELLSKNGICFVYKPPLVQ